MLDHGTDDERARARQWHNAAEMLLTDARLQAGWGEHGRRLATLLRACYELLAAVGREHAPTWDLVHRAWELRELVYELDRAGEEHAREHDALRWRVEELERPLRNSPSLHNVVQPFANFTLRRPAAARIGKKVDAPSEQFPLPFVERARRRRPRRS